MLLLRTIITYKVGPVLIVSQGVTPTIPAAGTDTIIGYLNLLNHC